jgi:hypothetical protein
MSALTPRLRAWLGTLAQPDQQTGQIALALAEESYTSVEIIVAEDVERLLALPKMEAVKPGAKIAIKKKLPELKVILLYYLSLCSSVLHTSCFYTCKQYSHFQNACLFFSEKRIYIGTERCRKISNQCISNT